MWGIELLYAGGMGSHTPVSVTLSRDEFERAGQVLGRAFFDTTQWSAVIPDDRIRLSKLQQMFVGTLKTTAVAGGVSERTAGFEAIAVWMPPGRSFGFWSLVRSGFASARFAVTPPFLNLRKMTNMLLQFEREHNRRMPDPHWYLMALGVDPEWQGQGLGSVLVRHGVERAGAEDMSVYLETETGPNVPFYGKLGFELIDEIVVDSYDLPMSLMVARPKNTHS